MAEKRAKAAFERIEDYKDDINRLKDELEDEVDEIEDKFDEAIEEIKPIEIKLKKKNVGIHVFNLLWIPVLKVDFSAGMKYFNTYTAGEIELE